MSREIGPGIDAPSGVVRASVDARRLLVVKFGAQIAHDCPLSHRPQPVFDLFAFWHVERQNSVQPRVEEDATAIGSIRRHFDEHSQCVSARL